MTEKKTQKTAESAEKTESAKDDKVTEVPAALSVPELQEKLDAMMSADKLGTDMELQKLMDAQMFIRFDKLQEKFAGNTVEDLQAAVDKSSTLVMNPDKTAVKPNLKPKRTVVLIRNVPTTVEAAQIRELICGCSSIPDAGSRVKDLHADGNSGVWFVNFEEENDAREVTLWLQQQNAPWGEEKVKCCMKSDHLVRSFFPATMAPTIPVDFSFMGPGFTMPMFMPPMGKKGDYKGKGKFGKGMKGKGKGFPGVAGNRSSTSIDQSDLGLKPADQNDRTGLYAGTFQKYSREEILSVCDKLQDLINGKPTSFVIFEKENEPHVKGVFATEPNITWGKVMASGVYPEVIRTRKSKKKDDKSQGTPPEVPAELPQSPSANDAIALNESQRKKATDQSKASRKTKDRKTDTNGWLQSWHMSWQATTPPKSDRTKRHWVMKQA